MNITTSWSFSGKWEKINSRLWRRENTRCCIHRIANVQSCQLERNRNFFCGKASVPLNVKVNGWGFDVNLTNPRLETYKTYRWQILIELQLTRHQAMLHTRVAGKGREIAINRFNFIRPHNQVQSDCFVSIISQIRTGFRYSGGDHCSRINILYY